MSAVGDMLAANQAVTALSPRVTQSRLGAGWRITLAAHNALNDRQARWFLLSAALAPAAVAAYWWSRGFWPVAPFAGLEWLTLFWVLRRVRQRGTQREFILIDENEVQIFTRKGQEDATTRFPRHWTRVRLRAPHFGLHPCRLCLESHGRSCQVGDFLPEDERRVLAARLKQLVGEMNDSPKL